MNDVDWGDLVQTTFRDPPEAARIIMGWGLGRDVLYTALALVAVVNTILFSISNIIYPPPPEAAGLYGSPMALYVIMLGSFVMVIQGLYWTARAMGGQGSMGDLIALLTWLQAIQAGVQVAQIVLLLVSPVLASILSLGVSLWLVWVTLHFISAAFHFDSLWRAGGVLIAAITGLALGLMFLGTLIGVGAMGVTGNV